MTGIGNDDFSGGNNTCAQRHMTEAVQSIHTVTVCVLALIFLFFILAPRLGSTTFLQAVFMATKLEGEDDNVDRTRGHPDGLGTRAKAARQASIFALDHFAVATPFRLINK